MNNLKNLLYCNTGAPEAIDAEIIPYPFNLESAPQSIKNPPPPPFRKGGGPEE